MRNREGFSTKINCWIVVACSCCNGDDGDDDDDDDDWDQPNFGALGVTCLWRNVMQLTNTTRNLRRPITRPRAQCIHHLLSSLQLLTSWTRDVDHRADTGFCRTDHSEHECRTWDRCKTISDNIHVFSIGIQSIFTVFVIFLKNGLRLHIVMVVGYA